jgi:prepilin-type N-terminal cleavage/methylation domain-containing protein
MTRRGFTAPEVSMALLLIAIMTLIVAAHGNGYRTRALDVSCTSNLKQIGTALHMYAMDNEGRLPPRNDINVLEPYVKNSQVFLCPRATPHTGPAPSEMAPYGPLPPEGGAQPESNFPTDYLFNPGLATDDLPSVVIAGDNAPNRHAPRGWIGVRLDGAAFLYPASEWQTRLGWVMNHAQK